MKHVALLLFTLLNLANTQAQTKISGSVSDEYGILPDANIVNTTTKAGAISNENGNFQIEAKKGDTLAISYVGYKKVELSIDNFKRRNVVLELDNLLDEVVLCAQSIKKERKAIGGCYSPRKTTCFYHTTVTYITEQAKEESVKMYPNPSKGGIFNLKFEKPFSEIKVKVYTLTGQLVLEQNEHVFKNKITIDLSNYPNGIYIINYIVDGKIRTSKKAIIG